VAPELDLYLHLGTTQSGRWNIHPPNDSSADDLGTTTGMVARTRSTSTMSTTVAVLLVVWLVIGAIAAGQRGYYRGSSETCARAGTIAVTVIAGPLNYVGVNPKVNCHVPQPSK